MIPAIQEILTDRFGTSRVSAKLPKDDSVVQTIKRRKNNASESEVLTSIVRGLAAVGCREESQIEDVVDSDYGVWDTETNQLIKIIEKGMPVKDTMFDKITKYGKELGIPTPYNEYTYHMIKALEEKNDGLFDYEGKEQEATCSK